MKNLRISSLDAGRPVADKDCQVCCRRRIRCDRTLPSCKKCEFRGLSCTGYAPKLRWNHGLASRGKLAGKIYQPSSSRTVIKDWPSELQPGLVQASSGSPDPTRSQTDLSINSDPSLDDYIIQQLHQTPSPDSQRWLNNSAWSDEIATLIHHFDRNVVGILAWVDLPENQWRKYVLPLASASPMLLYSISSLAAAHLSTTQSKFDYDLLDPSQLAVRYRGESLKCLNEELRDELRVSKKKEAKDLSKVHPLLATMLVLCYAEMLSRDSDVWKIHLRACRATIRDTISMLGNQTEIDETTRFLMKEVHDLEALASISSFSQAPGNTLAHPVSASTLPTVRWPFVDIMRDITSMERTYHDFLAHGGSVPEVNVEFWQTRLSETSAQTEDVFQTTSAPNDETGVQFSSILKAHHLACSTYFYQTISQITGSYLSPKEKSTEALYDTLYQLLGMDFDHSFKNVLAWPLFIAGTECRGVKDRQKFVHDSLLHMMANSGFWCTHRALDFLQSFWISDPEQYSTWVQYARSTLREEHSFMLY